MQSVVIRLRARIVERCPAFDIIITTTNLDHMITTLNYCALIDGFSVDELQNSLELAVSAGVQELYLWIFFCRHHISIDRVWPSAILFN